MTAVAVLVPVCMMACAVWLWHSEKPVAAPSASGPAAAKVNDTTVTRSQIDAEVTALVRSKPNQARAAAQSSQLTVQGGRPSPTLVSDTTGQLVMARVIEQEFTRRGLQVDNSQRLLVEEEVKGDFTPEVWNSLPGWLRKTAVERRARLDRLSADEAKIGLDDAALRAALAANAGIYGTTCVSQVLWGAGDPKAKQKVEEAAQLLLDKSVEFSKLAHEESVDASAAKGGDMGCLTVAQLEDIDPAFPTTLNALQPGQVSEPLETRYGWHLLRVDRREVPPFENSAPAVYADQVQRTATAGNQLVAKMMSEAKVSVEEPYGRWERQPNGAWWVTPPK